MSRRNRNARRSSPRVPVFIWVLAILLAGAVTWRGLASRGGRGHHPAPRADVTADHIVPAERYAAAADVARVYANAKEIPGILDGLYCYCECAHNFGHRSLLTCFESDHGANCEVCLREAALAFELHKQGKTLDEIRTQIDAMMRG